MANDSVNIVFQLNIEMQKAQ